MRSIPQKSKMSKMIDVFVEVLIFTALIGTMAGFIASAVANENISGLATTIIGLLLGFVALGMLLKIMKDLGVTKGGK